MMAKRRSILIKFSLISFAAVFLYFCIFDPFYFRAMSDGELIGIFKKHKRDFILLSEATPACQRIIGGGAAPADHVRRERKKLFEDAFHNIGSPKIVYERENAKFIYSSAPLFWIGPEWQKGIVRQDKCIDAILPTLDSPSSMLKGTFYCKKIDDGWWLIFENFN